jgi:uncharacterized protein
MSAVLVEAKARPAVSGYYQLIEADDGAFMYTLRAGNHETILTSRIYWSRGAALQAVAALRDASQQPERFQRHDADTTTAWFCVLDAEGRWLAKSENYSSRSGLNTGMASVQRNARSEVFRGLLRRATLAPALA